jgi:hypothetical protein
MIPQESCADHAGRGARGQTRSRGTSAAISTRIMAERQMGEFLKSMPKATGVLRQGPVVPDRDHGEPATLADIGITKKESARAQKLADIPAEEITERIAVAKASGGKLRPVHQYGPERRSPTARHGAAKVFVNPSG